LKWIEHGLAALEPLGLDHDGQLVASEVLTSFVRGFVARELAEQQAAQRSGVDTDARARMMRPYTDQVIAGGAHPRFAAIVQHARLPHEPDRGALFSAALEQVLDGIAAGRQRTGKVSPGEPH
jgi:hypothetical protein